MDDVQTDLSKKLNSRIQNSGGTVHIYTGGGNTGVMVRAPDFFDSGSDQVLPATFWHNDIYAPSQLYPSASSPWCPNNDYDGFQHWKTCDSGDKGAWDLAGVAVVMSDSMEQMFDNFGDIQNDDWGWGVFYATDANAADKRCVYREDWSGYDCPGGFIDWNSGKYSDDHSKSGSGAYSPGNPYAHDFPNSGGGGTGCHFDTNAIDQPDSDDPNGNLVQDGHCQCNYAFRDDWGKWVDAWSHHSVQKQDFQSRNWLNSAGHKAPAWAVDTAACWINNPRDLINLQNAIYWARSTWNNQKIPVSDWGSQQSAELRKYWGWNEIPVGKDIANKPQSWDAIIIKLPADLCQNQWGANDDPSCLTDEAKRQLESDLDSYVKNRKLLLGEQHITDHPGSAILFVREFGGTYGKEGKDSFGVNWSREFFCTTWQSPSHKYQVKSSQKGCFIDSGSTVV